MKQKTTIVALLLIVAILGLGIAYAAITNQTLTIEGNIEATTSDANFDVYFTGTPTTSGDGTTVATIDATNSKKATIDVSGLTTAGQTATATYTIMNASLEKVNAKLTKSVVHTNSTWFSVDATLSKDVLQGDGYMDTATLTITVTLLDTPVTEADESNAKDTITVTIDAQPQHES